MDAMNIFGMAAFALVFILWARVTRLERLLRENGIRPSGSKTLSGQLQKQLGQTLTLSFYDERMALSGANFRVLDVDETWVLLRADEGKKKERELLVRLDNVKQIKMK